MKSISSVRQTADSLAWTASDYVDSYVISAGDANAVAVTVPSGAKYAVFSATGNFYALFKNTATATVSLPVTNVTNGNAAMLNPAAARVDQLTNFSIAVPAACTVVIAWYNE